MRIVSQVDATVHQNSPHCVAREYPLGDRDINAAMITLSGRYPKHGFSKNSIAKEVVYVITGEGSLANGSGVTSPIRAGDMISIAPQEAYVFEGNMQLLIASSPAWSPDQYEVVM